jgi:hypothetical protein
MPIQLNGKKDRFVWSIASSGTFSVKSMYLDMLDHDTKYLKRYIWKMKVPLKIKVFIHSLKNQTGDRTGEAIGSGFYRSDQWFTGSQSDF